MKVVILCGGRGTRMEKETEYRPKPMIEIGQKPILWHILNIYSSYGFSDFVLCLGYKGNIIREYFLNYAAHNTDFTLNTRTGKMKVHNNGIPDWNITMADTGLEAMTGARIKRIERFIDSNDFMLTYGDAVSDIDIRALLGFHKKNKKAATMTGVFPIYKSRFGELSTDGHLVLKFVEKPVNCAALTNGGFFVLNRQIFDYLKDNDSCVFEKDALEKLVKERELALYRHQGFWHCMDTPRDLQFLNSLWAGGKAPWMDKSKQGKKNNSDWKEALDASY